MTQLQGKRIVLGISGSIAAYKSAFLVRLLIKAGAEVRVMMTESATAFVSPLTFSTLSRHAVATDVHDEGQWNQHVEWGLWADAMVFAPATAHTLARAAHGLASDMLTATYLSARCPVFFAPAMDLDMWHHPATQENISKLQNYGNFIIDVGVGELASGLEGPGRMAEPEQIVERLAEHFRYMEDFRDIHVLVNAGPTHEALDPVRFLGNHSTGKMGAAIAGEFARRGAHVHFVAGPGSETPDHSRVSVTRVTSAEDMLMACTRIFPSCAVAVLAAAVADYRPAQVAPEKIKKTADILTLELVKTPDIAATLGERKRADQVLIGFALETTDERLHAREKMLRKRMDMIVLNNPRHAGAGFGHDTNKVTFLYPDMPERQFDLKTKKAVAADIADAARQILSRHAKH